MNCEFLFIGIYQCQFLSPEDAVEYLQSIWDEEEANLDDQGHMSPSLHHPHQTQPVIMRMISQLTTMNQTCYPHFEKNKIKSQCPQYSQTPETMSHNGVQDIKQALGGKSVSNIFISMKNDKIL